MDFDNAARHGAHCNEMATLQALRSCMQSPNTAQYRTLVLVG